MARAVTDVDAVVGVGGVAEDAVVLLVEGVHRPPCERDLVFEDRGVVGERDVLPGAPRSVAGAADNLEPGGLAELGVAGCRWSVGRSAPSAKSPIGKYATG